MTAIGTAARRAALLAYAAECEAKSKGGGMVSEELLREAIAARAAALKLERGA